MMTPQDPRHGTYAGAQAHWRDRTPTCPACTQARRRYQKRRNWDAARGVARVVDATQTVRHLRELAVNGMTDGAIAAKAGVDPHVVRITRAGKSPRILATTAAALLGVTLDPHPEGWVDATGSRRRIQSLATLGWGKPALIEAAARRGHNLSYGGLAWVAREMSPRVRVGTRDAIAAAFDELCMKVAPPSRSATMARAYARKYNYPPPLAYEDIDDPADRPFKNTHGKWLTTSEAAAVREQNARRMRRRYQDEKGDAA